MGNFNLMADEPPAPKEPNNRVFELVVLGLVIGFYALIIYHPEFIEYVHQIVWGR